MRRRRRPCATLHAARLFAATLLAAALAGCDGADEAPDDGDARTGSVASANAPVDPGSDVGTFGPRLTASDLDTDPRLRGILRDCHQLGPYLRDTADPIAILVGKLEHGDADVMARACEELGAMGERSIPALERLLADQIQDRQRVLPMQNTVRALAANDSDEATRLLLVVLTHPEEALRSQALKVLAQRSPAPEHYDVLRDAAFFTAGQGQTSGLRALWSCDPDRATHQFLDWLLEGRGFVDVDGMGRMLASVTDPEVLERYRELPGAIPPTFTAFTDVALFVAGDESATVRTLERLVDPDPQVRYRVLMGAHAAESTELLDAFLRDDPDPDLRIRAAQHLVALLDEEDGEVAADALVNSLDDPLRQVRWTALDALVRRQYPVAVDRALALLDGGQQQLEMVLPSLHAAMLESPELAERARRRIVEKLDTDESLGLGNAATGHLQLVQALGLCPGAPSARLVLDIADATAPDQIIEEIRAYRYLAIQLANTGVDGREVVAERLVGDEAETDPIRRIDLLWAIGAHRDGFARTFLAEHVDRDDVDPWERVYAAHLLAKVGPTAAVAPILKAASRRFEGEPARALECLLFRWY